MKFLLFKFVLVVPAEELGFMSAHLPKTSEDAKEEAWDKTDHLFQDRSLNQEWGTLLRHDKSYDWPDPDPLFCCRHVTNYSVHDETSFEYIPLVELCAPGHSAINRRYLLQGQLLAFSEEACGERSKRPALVAVSSYSIDFETDKLMEDKNMISTRGLWSVIMSFIK